MTGALASPGAGRRWIPKDLARKNPRVGSLGDQLAQRLRQRSDRQGGVLR